MPDNIVQLNTELIHSEWSCQKVLTGPAISLRAIPRLEQALPMPTTRMGCLPQRSRKYFCTNSQATTY